MITVLGAQGFIGRRLAAELRLRGMPHRALGRMDAIPRTGLGDVVYCIGLTADFRSRPLDAVEAHACRLREILRESELDSLTYLSSTRLYRRAQGPAREDDPVAVSPLEADEIYDISKLMGESLTLSCAPKGRVVRLSNVYGDDLDSPNFLGAIVRDAVTTGRVLLETSRESAKDYVAVGGVVNALVEVVTRGTRAVYNVASGVNVSNGELADGLVRLTGCTVDVRRGAPTIVHPRINVSRMQGELGFAPSRVLDDLEGLVASFRRREGTCRR
jgi:nucleoside-diphosphate-sugar epimerase